MLNSVPIGAILLGWCVLMAVAPIRHPRKLGAFSWICSCGINELPFLFLCLVAASAIPAVVDGDLASPSGWIALVLALLTSAGLVVVVRRSLGSGASLKRALDEGLGVRWRADIHPALASSLRRHLPWPSILFWPWPIWRRNVERVANIAYGDGGRTNLLDVYRHRSHPPDAPTLIHLHGGRFRWGKKSREARPLLHHLASQGWTCISANYHLGSGSAAGFPEHLIDVKRVVAWVRSHGHEHGADPDRLLVAGSSAGAHLTAMAALTANDPTFQPGFESSDTSITAGIGLYGYYGQLGDDEHVPSTPLAYVKPDAPPFFVIHGTNDTYTPVEQARLFAERLQATSSNPVVYAELPGAQHSFDLFHSVRFENVIDAIETFAAWVRTRQADRGARPREGESLRVDGRDR